MRRFRLTVEYDGTEFAGFQVQAPNLRTVQGELEAAITRKSGGEIVRVHGAGRTDTGVHATGQVIHFDTEWVIPVQKLARALNGDLPEDVTVRNAEVADAGFHARFDATARTYRYVILNREAPSAMLGRFAWHVRDPLRTELMETVARELTGKHDFAAFGQPDEPGKSTVRVIERIGIEKRRDAIYITVRGNAFLRQQVRAFIGTLHLAGLGRITPDEVIALRDARDRRNCPSVAPARGLTLVRVDYNGTRLTRPGVKGESFSVPDGTEKD